MGTRNTALLIAGTSLYYACYLASSVAESDFWGNILSPLGAFIAFAILFLAFIHSNKADYRRYIWLIFSLAPLAWGFADILWAVDEMVLHNNPGDNVFGQTLYFVPNICLLLGIFTDIVKNSKRWNAIQLMADSAAVAVSCLLLVWILILRKFLSSFQAVDDWTMPASLVVDFIILISISAWYLSLIRVRIYAGLKIAAACIVLYVLVDMTYFYLYARELYIPNSIIDALYMTAFLGLAIGVRIVPGSYFMTDAVRKFSPLVDYPHKGLLLLPLPVLVVLYEGFNIPDLFVCGLIITFHNALSHFIHMSSLNEQLLRREKVITQELEKRITERTKELVRKNEQLDFLSNQDTVTSLYNRRYFLTQLEKDVKCLGKDDTMTLAFLDLDRFKTINDTYGHFIGDHILIELAKRLLTFENPDTMIARLGGDEFVIAFHGNYTLHDAEEIMKRIMQKCSEPIHVGEFSFDITISVGISVYPIDADSSDMLLRNADMAMYQAKKEGCNRIVIFNDILKQKTRWKNKIEISLKKADFNKEFDLFYQPQFTAPDKKLIGMEALLRWNCPGKGYVAPSEFIPIAEEINWIIPIGEWVMTRAVSQITKWNRKYGSNLKMAFNVSPKQLDQPDFTQHVFTLLAHADTPAEWVDIEITEGVALEGKYRIEKIAAQFKEAGLTVSIDDFGTGYSSLSCLKLFPFQRVKIAMPLIDNIIFDRYDLQIVRSILLLAESIGVDCIAEGIETREQFDLLHGLGCRQMQGFYLGRPMPAGEFEKAFLGQSDREDYTI